MDIVVQHAPHFTLDQARQLAQRLWGVEGAATPLPSERDQNFRLSCANGREYVLKLANATEQVEVLAYQNAALEHLARTAPGLALPRVCRTAGGEDIVPTIAEDGTTHLARLLTWVPGELLARVKPHTERLFIDLGRRVGEMDAAFAGFSHPAMHRPLQWNLAGTSWIRNELGRFTDAVRRAMVERVVDAFEREVAPHWQALRTQVVHNDWNDYNVVVATDAPAEPAVAGVVDFGDMVHSATVSDLAVAIAYAILDKTDPVGAAAAIVRGYHETHPLTELELDVLFHLVRARLAISVTMAACQSAQAPGNDYLLISQQPAWTLLAQLDAVSPAWARGVFRRACGLPADPRSPAIVEWLNANQAGFASVVDADLRTAPLTVLDLGVGSLDIPRLDIVIDPPTFDRWVTDRLRAAGTAIGIGQYDEARLVYVTDLFRHRTNWSEENRTVHIGIDVFLDAGAAVHAPLAGVVHSTRNNAAAGDYGPTIILEHEVGQGLRFYTLYGHLATRSLEGLQKGRRFERGEVLGWLGTIDENGGWPPHLHFQVMTDMLGREGDFPGVAAPGERETWLDFCPDPNLVLGIPAARFTARPPTTADMVARRRERLGPSLSVSYRRPITMVRGHRQYLFDGEGRRYLDAVNNVPHVGHSHPRVVEAASRQLSVLNTNTRYLHHLIVEYAGRLTALLPDPLDVCFIVNSGSEANELAMRLAQAATGHTGIIVVDGAYHGNTSGLVNISPYKFDGPGGRGCPAHVRVATMPDPYRGPYRSPYCGSQPNLGAAYAASVGAAARDLAGQPCGLSAFIAESILSCGGQIVLPEGYLETAYREVRGAGGVCIADEVQVGFGRVGTHMWAFETQSVVPDIVTMGKPIGNGFPLAAVVTRREIAEAFANGMEYFNTFGGGQAACSVGLAVLDVMKEEGLQAHALEVGEHLEARLRELAVHFPVIGDVRGLGLFLGVEFVTDPASRKPAAAQADYCVNRMRDHGILASTDGPLHNVIKIKPPLPFTIADADRFADVLGGILKEDAAQA